MRTNLIKLGDGYAVRIPKKLIDLAGLPKSFNLIVGHGEIVLRRYKNPRYGWAKAFREAVRIHGNELSEEDIEWLNAPGGPIVSTSPDASPKGRGRPRTPR